LTSKVKDFYRFHTREIEDTLYRLKQKEDDIAKILVLFINDYLKKFYVYRSSWYQAVSCIGELDCLCSLA
jgi:DNA mismatch repair ATPase MutS